MLAGCLLIFFACSQNFERIKGLVSNWTTNGMTIGFIVFTIGFGVLGALTPSKKKRSKRKTNKNVSRKAKTGSSNHRRSMECRSDDEILHSPLDRLTGAEFERLLALYFRGQGYVVQEVGVGGKDGGVDLVITDRRGEKTAVQAKCYADHHSVGVPTVRELVGAKRNHDCILTLLITTSDLTEPAKREADQFKVDYWHGALVTQKLIAWGKWNPKGKYKPQAEKAAVKQQIQTTRNQVAVAIEKKCICGAAMVSRKSREGKSFLGCSTYPKCRHTHAI